MVDLKKKFYFINEKENEIGIMLSHTPSTDLIKCMISLGVKYRYEGADSQFVFNKFIKTPVLNLIEFYGYEEEPNDNNIRYWYIKSLNSYSISTRLKDKSGKFIKDVPNDIINSFKKFIDKSGAEFLNYYNGSEEYDSLSFSVKDEDGSNEIANECLNFIKSTFENYG